MPAACRGLSNEQPRGKPRGITERNPQEHAQQAAGYSSSRKSGINTPLHRFADETADSVCQTECVEAYLPDLTVDSECKRSWPPARRSGGFEDPT